MHEAGADSASSQCPAMMRLTYFDVRALGEPVRYLLSYSGLPFEDVRLAEEWPALKHKMPFGKLPTLEIDGEVFHQSAAICRYLGVRAGLAGSSPEEALRIDQAVGAFNDLTAEVARMFNNPDPKSKEQQKEVLLKETLPFYLGRFDQLIADNGGYLANNKLSWGDLYVVAYSESLPVIFAPVDPTSGYTHWALLREKVQALPGVRRWLDERPKTFLL